MINKIIISMILNCLLLPSSFQNKSRTDREEDDLLGSVHTVKVVKTPVSSSGTEAKDNSRFGWQITIYNPTGNKTEEQYFDGSGVLQNKRVFSYSTSGKLAEIVERNASDLVISKTVHTPNTAKNEVEGAYYNKQDKLMSKRVRVYNEQGRFIKLSTFNPDGMIKEEATSSYNDKGSLVETSHWSLSGEKRNLSGRTTFVYLDDDRKIKVSYFDSIGAQVESIIVSKNSDGSNIEIEQYDAKDNLIGVKLLVRKLDSMGNWIVENTFQKDPKNGSAKLMEVTNRTITYY